MKKLLLSLATVALTAGSLVAGTTSVLAKNQTTHRSKAVATVQQVATKINAMQNVHFNYQYWANKDLNNYLPQIRQILVNEKVLTKAEAALITKVTNDTPITTGNILLTFFLHDKQQTEIATANVDFRADGDSAAFIANLLANKTVNLNLYSWQNEKIADHIDQFRNVLVNDLFMDQQDAQYVYDGNVTWPITKVQTAPGCVFVVKKDGQTASAGNVTLNIFSHTVQDIAKILETNTIHLAAPWAGRNVHNYEAQLNYLLVYGNLLTPGDAQCVYWPDERQTLKYHQWQKVPFVVSKLGQVTVGQMSIYVGIS